MKKLLKVLIISVLVALFSVSLFACKNGDENEKTGLLYKMYPGDDYYTVYGYVDEGKELKVLDISAYLAEKGVEDVKIGRIKAGAFKDNNTLTEVIVPDTVTVIDQGAFANMKALQTLTIPFVGNTKNADSSFNASEPTEDKSVDAERTFGYVFGTEEYEGGAPVSQAYSTEGLNTYYMPLTFKSVTVKPAEDYKLPMYAFSGNTFIEKVTLSDKVVAIGEASFKNCYALKEICIPSGVTEIGKEAFSGCTSIKDGLTFAENSTLTKLGEKAFYGCAKLNQIALPASLTRIPYGAFSGCVRLANVNLGGVTEIEAWAFYECKKLNYVGKGEVADKTYDLTGVVAKDFAFAETVEFGATGYTFVNATANVFYKVSVA